VKFTSSGEVVLSADLAQQDQVQPDESLIETPYCIKIEIRDTGIGIPSDQLPRLFLSFNQGDASINRRYGGTGLGLAISKRLVEMMGGKIDVESKPGEGTRFHFTVLMDHAQGPVAANAAPLSTELSVITASRNLRVLVAEDNAVNQIVLLKMLERLGVHADLVTDGSQAIEAVEENRYDLVLMDVEMPGVDGLEATREIRASLPAGRQPIIFGLTAHATTEYRDICLAAGMNGYLTKPLEADNLRDLIAELSMLPSSVARESRGLTEDSQEEPRLV
jgi:CheY-like chemotaxis protein